MKFIFLKNFSNTSYLKSIGTLFTGSLIAQLITIILSPVITRIYTPEDLGYYSLLLSVIAMFGTAITGRYDMPIVKVNNESEVYSLIVASSIINVIFSSVVSVCSLAYFIIYENMYSNIGITILLIFPMFIMTGVINTVSSYNNRYKEYKLLSSVSINRAITQNSGQVLFGIFGLGIKGLLISNFLSLLVGLNAQFKRLKRNLTLLKEVNFKEVKEVLIRYNNQLFFSTPSILLNTVSYSLINFLISYLYGAKVLGYYSLSYRMLGLPLSLISMNVARVFFEQASSELRLTGMCINSFKKTFKFLFYIAIPMGIILIILAPTAFSFVFGSSWKTAGIYVQVLTPMFVARFIILSLTSVLVITDNQKYELKMQALFIVSTSIAFLLSKFLNLGIFYFLSLISLMYLISYIIFGLKLFNFSSRVINLKNQ
ncbi:oligosaccharide flippase family protein [Neobacillus vireti]|uniref:oligosaccharide flippase family protein n=1 Tax=Neobacillus vireti TaxID=220686 RepID=UPI002FFE5472